MKCGKPYCACVGQCFAESSPLDDKGKIMTTNTTQQVLDAALAECERLRADAERYRWLRDNNYDRTVCQIHTIKHWYEPHSKTGEPTEWRVRLRGPRNLDAAIDAARAKP